jgi:hypothetical protein
MKLDIHSLALLAMTARLGAAQVAVNQCVGDCIVDPTPPAGATGCYILTEELNNKVGAVWGSEQADITSDFNVSASLYFGDKEDGADGIAFVIQNALGNTAVGSDGGNLGFLDIGDFFAVDVDTYWNHNLDGQMKADHVYVSSELNGGFGTSESVTNVEDDGWHAFEVTWIAGTLTVRLGGAEVMTTSVSSISDQLDGAPSSAYFGFTAATGGHTNLQKICSIVVSQGLVAAGAAAPAVIASASFIPECDNFAVHGTTAVTFGALNTVHNGDVGCSTIAAITETAYAIDLGHAQYYPPNADLETCMFAKAAAVAAFKAARSEYTTISAPMGGLTFHPGKYYSPATLSTAAGQTITLDGDNLPDAKFTFQAFSTLGTGAGTKFNLINGAKAENVLWEVGSAATIGAGGAAADDMWVGTILADTGISVGADVALYGRILAVTAITFGANQIIDPEFLGANAASRYLRH